MSWSADHSSLSTKRRSLVAWNKRMLGYRGTVQVSPALGDALNPGYRYLEVRCLGCATIALDIMRRPRTSKRRFPPLPSLNYRAREAKRRNLATGISGWVSADGVCREAARTTKISVIRGLPPLSRSTSSRAKRDRAQLAMTNCRETGGFGSSHSVSFDHRFRPDTLRTAIATAFFCPTRTTSFLPRVTPV